MRLAGLKSVDGAHDESIWAAAGRLPRTTAPWRCSSLARSTRLFVSGAPTTSPQWAPLREGTRSGSSQSRHTPRARSPPRCRSTATSASSTSTPSHPSPRSRCRRPRSGASSSTRRSALSLLARTEIIGAKIAAFCCDFSKLELRVL